MGARVTMTPFPREREKWGAAGGHLGPETPWDCAGLQPPPAEPWPAGMLRSSAGHCWDQIFPSTRLVSGWDVGVGAPTSHTRTCRSLGRLASAHGQP